MANQKEKYKTQLVEILANPENDFPTRGQLAKMLGLSKTMFYRHFRPEDLDAIEAEALEVRRRKYARALADVDAGLLKRAKDGDPAACKLVYQRFEGWSEKQIRENTFGIEITVQQQAAAMRSILDEIESQPHGLGIPLDNSGRSGIATEHS
jgi:AcrR family transcriptional regulator